MPTFAYKAINQEGQSIKGCLEADSPGAANRELESRGLLPTQLGVSTPLTRGLFGGRKSARWKIEDKVLFTRKFASLFKAGIPLLTVLEMIARQTPDPRVADVLLRVRDSIAGGKPLNEALAAFPELFDSVYVGAVRAAESTGRLDLVLDHTAAYLEREMITRRKVKETLRYPVMVVAAIFIAGVVVMKFVVPQFMSFYDTYHGQLPGPTLLLITISQLTERWWWLGFPALLPVGAGWWWFNKTEPGRLRRDKVLLGLPLAGSLFLKVAVSRFVRLFGVLYSAGVPVTTALEITRPGVGNEIIANEVDQMTQRIIAGGMAAEAPTNAVIPDLVYQMIGIGFESGQVEQMLAEVARHYEQEIDYDVRKLTDRLQPILLLFMAAGVIFLALAVMMPLWNLNTLFH